MIQSAVPLIHSRNTTKKYNIMAFNAADKVNFATWNQARLERDLSNKKIYQEEELPESGAGSEFKRKLREEARRKKYGIVLKEFWPEDQPWLLRAPRRFKGIKKGGVTENTSYYIFTQCPDGAFEAFPVHNWYNFTPLARHRTLTAEESTLTRLVVQCGAARTELIRAGPGVAGQGAPTARAPPTPPRLPQACRTSLGAPLQQLLGGASEALGTVGIVRGTWAEGHGIRPEPRAL
uniref:Transcription initiation factor IIF subunit alpha n=1 Tax=Oryctolagus cuniculus TaxID=9986 RepID=G1TSZ1_RABIT